MNKGLKIIMFLLSIVGVFTILTLLNYISDGNVTNIGLGNFILMQIGLIVILLRIGQWLSLL